MFQKYQERYVITQQPDAGLTEKLQWASRVSTAYRGDESRRSLRVNPEVELDMTYRVAQEDRGKILALINTEKEGGERLRWWCPLWHLAYHVERGLMESTFKLHYPIEHGSDTNSGSLIVFNKRGGIITGEADSTANITTYTRSGDTITLPAFVERPFAVVFLLKATLVGERSLAGFMGDDELNIRYRLETGLCADTTTVRDDIWKPFDGYDTLFIPSLEAIPEETDEEETVVSFQTGRHDVIRRRDQPRSVMNFRWVGDWGYLPDSKGSPSRFYDPDYDAWENIVFFRRWLWKRQGRTSPFLYPSFTHDFIPTVGATTADGRTTINISPPLETQQLNYLKNVSPYVALMEGNHPTPAPTILKLDHTTVTNTGFTVAAASSSSLKSEGESYKYGCIVSVLRLDEDGVEFNWTRRGLAEMNTRFTTFYQNTAAPGGGRGGPLAPLGGRTDPPLDPTGPGRSGGGDPLGPTGPTGPTSPTDPPSQPQPPGGGDPGDPGSGNGDQPPPSRRELVQASGSYGANTTSGIIMPHDLLGEHQYYGFKVSDSTLTAFIHTPFDGDHYASLVSGDQSTGLYTDAYNRTSTPTDSTRYHWLNYKKYSVNSETTAAIFTSLTKSGPDLPYYSLNPHDNERVADGTTALFFPQSRNHVSLERFLSQTNAEKFANMGTNFFRTHISGSTLTVTDLGTINLAALAPRAQEYPRLETRYQAMHAVGTPTSGILHGIEHAVRFWETSRSRQRGPGYVYRQDGLDLNNAVYKYTATATAITASRLTPSPSNFYESFVPADTVGAGDGSSGILIGGSLGTLNILYSVSGSIITFTNLTATVPHGLFSINAVRGSTTSGIALGTFSDGALGVAKYTVSGGNITWETLNKAYVLPPMPPSQ